jgi:2-methylcitrate dehydratase PrpD
MVDNASSTAMDKIIANVLETRFENFDKDTLQNARDRIMDTVGCLIGGAADPSNPELVKLIMDFGGKPEATVLMYGGKVPASHAAMVNCITCRSFDYEPVSPVVENSLAAGHVSGTTVMTAISVSEATGASGRELITAMLLGDDLASRLLNTSGFTLALGWDGNGTANALGATAIAGRLLGLNAYQMRNAFGLVLSQLSGSAQNIWEANTAFKLPIGLAARNAIFSAQLAAAGWTAPRDAIMGKFGYYGLFTDGIRHEELLTKDLGKKYWSDRTFKPYPCCRANHGPLDCALDIVYKNKIEANDIQEAVLYMSPARLNNFCGQPWEIGDFAHGNAIFSYRFTVATALLKKSVKPEHFTTEAIRDPGTNAFIKKIKLAELSKKGVDVALKVVMKDGREYTAESRIARGDIPGNPLSRDELTAKFRGNVEFANRHTKQNADKLLALLEKLEDLGNINEIIRLLVP